jgi:predicted metal-binding membrane protein
MFTTDQQPPSRIEILLESTRPATFALLVAVPLVCWAWIVVMARDMYGEMSGASAWMMTATWDAFHVLLLWAMWSVMMIGMMLPTAAGLILVYGAAARRRYGRHAGGRIYALAAGYVAVWVLFSTAATLVQRILAVSLVLSPMMELSVPALSGAVLIGAGLYQFTPAKQVCLKACQSPMGFLMTRWRDGTAGAFRLGVEHGVHCLGCCWALMTLLFVGGVMNLLTIAVLTTVVALEKIGVLGRWASRATGIVLLFLGAWTVRSVL